MIPTNVMSFMKKIVTAESTSTSNNNNNSDPGHLTNPDSSSSSTLGKIRQTLSTSLLTAQDKVNKMSPKNSNAPEIITSNTFPSSTKTTPFAKMDSSSKILTRMGTCRVCLKLLKGEEFYQICFECTQRVCDDCASYSKSGKNEDKSKWRCSVCRRRLQSKVIVPQESTDSLLDIPIADPIQRRHSDIKMSHNSHNDKSSDSLALPRSPEHRRHSDVSPSSLKELEKLKKNKKSTADLTSWSQKSACNSRCSSPVSKELDFNYSDSGAIENPQTSQRPVYRQRSYDNEIKPSSSVTSIIGQDQGLKLPSSIPRRASAYDVRSSGLIQSSSSPSSSPNFDEYVATSPRRSSVRSTTGATVIIDDNDNIVRNSEMSVQLVVDEDRRSRRASQISNISNIRALPATPWSAAALEELEAPKKQLSIDAEAIKIIIHDVDSAQSQIARRRLILRKDPNDKAHRTRGFGMRVVGGKTGIDGRLFAYIVWTVPGGPAEKGGLQQGDKVLEWGGISLVDKSFEEVCSIMDHTGDTVELLVEHLSDFRMCDLCDENPSFSVTGTSRRISDVSLQSTQSEHDDKPQLSATRRKLPKTPDQNSSSSISSSNCKQLSGRIQLQVWYNDDRHELGVAILAADNLVPRDESFGFGFLPEAYTKLSLMPLTSDYHTFQTTVAPANCNPIWNSNFVFQGVPGDHLMKKYLEVTLWDLCPHRHPVFLGACALDLKDAFFDDRTVWYRLKDFNHLKHKAKSYMATKGSKTGDITPKQLRKHELARYKSVSNESIGDISSLLHPDTAFDISQSRRGSSQSECLEAELFELTKDLFRSLPGSRRSSYQSINQDIPDDAVIKNYSREHRRSSSSRSNRDPEEILKSLKEVKIELNRSMSASDSRHNYNQHEDDDDNETNFYEFKTRRRSRSRRK